MESHFQWKKKTQTEMVHVEPVDNFRSLMAHVQQMFCFDLKSSLIATRAVCERFIFYYISRHITRLYVSTRSSFVYQKQQPIQLYRNVIWLDWIILGVVSGHQRHFIICCRIYIWPYAFMKELKIEETKIANQIFIGSNGIVWAGKSNLPNIGTAAKSFKGFEESFSLCVPPNQSQYRSHVKNL